MLVLHAIFKMHKVDASKYEHAVYKFRNKRNLKYFSK